VVITIIGILIALLLPAVQAAREAARQAQCINNLKQVGLAALGHEQVNRWFPTGGWSDYFVGDPNAGFGTLQPGGFLYNILPYMEQQPLHDLALNAQRGTARYGQLEMQMVQVPVATYTCPTRRACVLHPTSPASETVAYYTPNYGFYPPVQFQADYVGNGGSSIIFYNSPGTWAEAANPKSSLWVSLALLNGVTAQRSQVRMSDITDGASVTYLAGEKYCDPDNYLNCTDWGDDQSAYSADCDDTIRWTGQDTATTIVTNPPLPDTCGVGTWSIFGSAHAVGFNMAMCDGSVHVINYSINPEIHRRLGNRRDGLTVDAKTW
jgi:prepilin-type processing-associated H-X9-DG protein